MKDTDYVDYPLGPFSTIRITRAEARMRRREERIAKLVGYTVGVLLIGGLVLAYYWVMFNVIHAQPIICFGCGG